MKPTPPKIYALRDELHEANHHSIEAAAQFHRIMADTEWRADDHAQWAKARDMAASILSLCGTTEFNIRQRLRGK